MIKPPSSQQNFAAFDKVLYTYEVKEPDLFVLIVFLLNHTHEDIFMTWTAIWTFQCRNAHLLTEWKDVFGVCFEHFWESLLSLPLFWNASLFMHCLTKLARYEVPMVDVGFYAGQKFFQFNRQKVNCEANNKVSRCGKLIVALVFCSFLKCVSGAQFKYVVPRSQGAGYCFLWLQTRNTARNCSMFCMTDEIR